jgi:anti-sigma factor RsiW
VRPQHLSDEAIAAFADGVLSGCARERARRHTAQCPECAHSVAVQREAVWALRAAPAPSLPTGLLDRLRDVPVTTPISVRPAVIAPDGTSLMATFAGMPAAALVPEQPAVRSHHRIRPIVGTAAAVAAAGVLAVSSAAHASGSQHPAPVPGPVAPAHVQPAGFQSHR